jgi:hypothetical protein
LAFLIDIWDLDSAGGWEHYYLVPVRAGVYEHWPIRTRDELASALEELFALPPGERYFSLQAFLPRGGRNSERVSQLNGLFIDLDGGTELEHALSRLEELGLEPHYVVQTSPLARFQLFFKLQPVRLGGKNRGSVLGLASEVSAKLAKLVRGDPHAASPVQLARLPHLPRETPDGIWHPPIIVARPGRYKLGEVAARLRERALIPRGRAKTKGRKLLKSPAVQWLLGSQIPEGHRNSALVALAYAFAGDGLPLDEALPILSEWARTHTGPPLPEHEVLTTIRACYANPKGLSVARLAAIEGEEGPMPPDVARSVLKAQGYPKRKRGRGRGRGGSEEALLLEVLAVLQDLQRANGGRPVSLTRRELAERSGVSLSTLDHAVLPALRARGLAKGKRGKPLIFDLLQTGRPR